MKEFSIIEKYFTRSSLSGDDAALITVPDGMELAVTIDTMVEGTHFFPDCDPRSLGHKILAVNLSDLAAMGAEPHWITLALTLPEVNNSWLEQFSIGLFDLAEQYSVELIGGDTTKGNLTVSLQAHGLVPRGEGLLRCGAKVGDSIFVTGDIGDAGLALKKYGSGLLQEKLELPQPRVFDGISLRNIANSAIDISDGLLADLGHILKASGVGATISTANVPISKTMQQWLESSEGDWQLPLTAGEDYELCFTVPAAKISELQGKYCRIGEVTSGDSLQVLGATGESLNILRSGFQHF